MIPADIVAGMTDIIAFALTTLFLLAIIAGVHWWEWLGRPEMEDGEIQ